MQFWHDRVDRTQGPLYLAIAEAIDRAVEARELRAGDRLPPQRQLARALAVDLTTVTRGYDEARRRGLVEAAVGRGTFVRATAWAGASAGAGAALVDLSMNLPPLPEDPPLRDLLREGLTALLREADIAALMTYHLGAGGPQDRAAGAAWLRPLMGEVAPERTLVSTGAQCALTALLGALTRPGDIILTEPLSYPRFRAATAQWGVQLSAVASDAEGVQPAALDAACRSLAPKALYCTPTLHNPTTVTMPPARRQAIADVLRRHGVPLIEDDAYGRLAREPLAAIASLVPELGYYIGTLSKCLSPGLRIAYVVAPDRAAADRLEAAIRATSLMPPPLMIALVSGWVRQGTAEALCAGVRREIAARQAIARDLLPADSFVSDPDAPHGWLTLPPQWHRMAFCAHVRALGLALAPSDPFAVATPAPNAVRIGLGAAENQAALRRALQSVAAALRAEPPPELADIV